MREKLPPGTLDNLWNDPANWRIGSIYSCKADPRIIVSKRVKWAGWTMNFAHAGAWIYLIVGIAIAAALLIGVARSDNSALLIITVIFVIVLSFLLGAWFSSPRRYERHD